MTATRVSAVTAYSAHREWASRPPDERYASVHALYDAARARHARIEERTTETVDLRTEVVDDDDLAIGNTSDRTAALTHWSFGQLATIASAPPSYQYIQPSTKNGRGLYHAIGFQGSDLQELTEMLWAEHRDLILNRRFTRERIKETEHNDHDWTLFTFLETRQVRRILGLG